ncbi:hypothetical protein B0J17DRAFT_658242, partial [Rhizoctonia solani]
MKWDEWGEDATRWFENISFETCWTPGPQCLEVTRSDDRTFRLSTFNFHPAVIRRYLSQLSSKSTGYRSRVVNRVKVIDKDTPTIIHGLFRRPIMSRLPYMVVTKGWNGPAWHRWVIDGEHIVGIDTIWGKKGTHISVYKLY